MSFSQSPAASNGPVPAEPTASKGKNYGKRPRIAPPRSKSAGSVRFQPGQQPGDPPEFRPEYFKPGFTAISNAALDDSDIMLNRSQNKVFQWAQRFTTGWYCREWVRLILTTALLWCRLPESTFYQALKELIAMGLLERCKDVEGRPWVRITAAYQPLKPEHIATLWTPFPALQPAAGPGADPLSGEGDSEKSESPSEKSESPSEKSEAERAANARLAALCDQPKEQPLVEIPHRQQHAVVVQLVAIAEEPDFLAMWTSNEETPFPPLPVVGHEDEGGREALPPSELQPDRAVIQPPAPVPAIADRRHELRTAAAATRPTAALASAKKRKQAADAKAAASGLQVRVKLTASQLAQADALQAHGVAAPRAAQLARSKDPAAIRRALADLAGQENVRNAGGWLYEGLSSGRYDDEPASHPAPAMSEADAATAKERRAAPLVSTLSYAEREEKRWADLEAKRQREAEQERTEREARTQQTARETAAALAALSADERAALRGRALASFGGKAMPEGVIVGAMVGLLETDQRRALALTSRGG